MKLETRRKWDEVRAALKTAEQHENAGEHDAARHEAWHAAALGLMVVTSLMDQNNEEMRLACDRVHDLLNWQESCFCSRDYLDRAYRFLEALVNLLPPEKKLPLPTRMCRIRRTTDPQSQK